MSEMKPFRSHPPEGSVGVVLPIRDDLRFFKLCFHSLIGFADYPFMLTIVDNMSGIRTVQYLESLRRNHPVTVLTYQKEHSLAAEFNLGTRSMFAYSTVQYGVVLTPTVVFEPLWLSKMVQSAQAASASVPATVGESSDVLLFKRSTYETLEGFRDGTLDPARDFAQRLMRRPDGGMAVADVFVHKFKLNGFDPRGHGPSGGTQEMQEANHVGS